MPELTATQWLVIVAGFVGFHLVLGILSFRWHPLWLLAVAFLLVALFTKTNELPFYFFLKYVRTYICGLMALVAVWLVGVRQLRGAPLMWVLFALFYALAGFYSGHIPLALFYKGQFFALVLAGSLLALSVQSIPDLRRLLGLILIAVAAVVAVIFGGLLASPGQLVALGRISVYGANANGLGAIGAFTLPLCLYHLVFAPGKLMRGLAIGTGSVGLLLVLLSGSRGAVGTAVIGVFVVLLPLMKRPGLLAVICLIGMGLVWGVFSFVEQSEAVQRLGTWNFESRTGPWTAAMELIREAWVFGHGWVSQAFGGVGRRSTLNLHSMYLQVFASIGLVGLLFMAVAYACIGVSMLKGWWMTAHNLAYRGALCFGAAYALQVMANGVVESGPIVGSTYHPIFMAFGVGLVYQIPRLLAHDFYAAQQQQQVTLALTGPRPAPG